MAVNEIQDTGGGQSASARLEQLGEEEEEEDRDYVEEEDGESSTSEEESDVEEELEEEEESEEEKTDQTLGDLSDDTAAVNDNVRTVKPVKDRTENSDRNSQTRLTSDLSPNTAGEANGACNGHSAPAQVRYTDIDGIT